MGLLNTPDLPLSIIATFLIASECGTLSISSSIILKRSGIILPNYAYGGVFKPSKSLLDAIYLHVARRRLTIDINHAELFVPGICTRWYQDISIDSHTYNYLEKRHIITDLRKKARDRFSEADFWNMYPKSGMFTPGTRIGRVSVFENIGKIHTGKR